MTLKICIINEHLFSKGGAELATLALAKNLNALGLDVTIITSGQMNQNLPFHIHSFEMPDMPIMGLRKIIAAIKVSQILSKKHIDCDIYHTEGALILAKIISNNNKIWITTAHGTLHKEKKLVFKYPLNFYFKIRYMIGSFFLYHVEKLVYILAKAPIIAVSSHTKNELIQMGIPEGQIVVVPNGVDCKLFKPTTKNSSLFPRLLSIQANPTKGTNELLYSVSRLKSTYPLVSLTIIGFKHDDYFLLLKKSIKKLKIEKNVVFIPYVDHDELPLHYAKSHVVILPSFNEGMPLTLLESLASGTPIVHTAICGSEDFSIPELTSTCIAKPDPKLIFCMLLNILRNYGEYCAKFNVMSNHIQKTYDWAEIARYINMVYTSLVNHDE